MSTPDTPPKAPASTPLRAWLLLVLLSCIWGSSYVLIKRGLLAYAPIEVGLLRLAVSGLAFLPFAARQWRGIGRRELGVLFVVGAVGSGIPAFLFALAQTNISSSMAGVLNSLTPLFTLLLGVLAFGAPLLRRKVAGIALGFVGALLLILLGKQAGLSGNPLYGLFVVLATVGYATSTNLIKARLQRMPAMRISTVSFILVGLPALAALLLFTDFWAKAQTPAGIEGLRYVVFLALASTVFASVLYFRLIQMTTPVFASTISYLAPVVALLFGGLDGEPITPYHLLALLLIFGGVYLTRQ